MKSSLTVEVFKGEEASVNSYIFSNGSSIMVMDALRSTENAEELAMVIKAKALPLTHLLITHGHPDHYIGMHHLKSEFPDAQIMVSNQETKEDIINFSTWMESVGWLDAEPALKPKSSINKAGFDYQNEISVLDSNSFNFNGGGTLEIYNNYSPAEAEHLTTVFSKDLNALFTSDFCYNGVHLWLGQGVDAAHIANWKQQLQNFKEQYTDESLTVYPGHGESSNISLFDTVLKYISDFEQIIKDSETREHAIRSMRDKYPNWEQSDFLLMYSVENHMNLKESK